ncbi:MAG: FtsX-like permease family protein [Patescibacteria group bacterium]
MGIISRGIKNAFRNTIRTVSITFILALSIAMSLIMLLALQTVQAKISSVKSSIGNSITVSPAGVRGFEGGGELLTDQNASDIASIAHVSGVVKTLSDQLVKEGSSTLKFGNDDSNPNNFTNLDSAIEPGSFGNRMRVRSGGSETSANGSMPANFSMPISVMATSDFGVISSLGINQFDLISGDKFDVNITQNVALIGTDLAAKNSLDVDSTFTAYGQSIKIVGIYDTGNKFTNGSVVMPFKTLQVLSSQENQINSLIILIDSIDNVSKVQSAITDKLGSDKVDVVSQQENLDNAIAPLENIKTISLYSLIGSLIAGAVIILMTMMMIVRERRREIGVLKAIGSSNIGIMAQFTVESLSLTFLSSILGIIIGFIFSNPVLKVLVSNSETNTSNAGKVVGEFARGGGPGMMVAKIGGGIATVRENLTNLHAVLNYEVILYGLLVAVVIAIIGSAIPAFFIAKIRPAEVMRAE